MNLTNILFENFSGYTSGKYGRAVARFTCSPNAVCENIQFKNFTITPPCGDKQPVILCDGIKGDLGLPCVSYNSTEGKAAIADKCTVPTAEGTVLPWN